MANENQSQAAILQQKLNEEVKIKNELTDRLKEVETAWTTKESQVRKKFCFG